ncbi:hypothetical protein VNI00_015722 [Paramarasmius palmivorus]|uniref:F-box domain-containing protein n=1 Tax=Paramarasmius palmivorus TaxID=297713 RepID=A0AAW0BH81_9AGAR
MPGKCNNHFVPDLQPYRYPKDLLELLRFNVLPSETDASKTALFLQDVESELRRYDEELSRLRLVSEQLEIQRKELLKKADQHRSWLSPIRKLPVEVLQTIFLDTCFTGFFHGLIIQSTESEKAFCYAQAYELSCVSFHWKTVASGLPQLWSSLKVDVLELDTDPRPLLELYLDNSRVQPLDMEIRCRKHGIALRDNRSLKDRLGRYGLRILKMLFEHIHRCEILSLDIEGEESELMDMVGSGLCMPNLHTLRTRLDDIHRAGHFFWESIRDNSPNLKVVRSETLLGTDVIRYENLTVLDVDWAYETLTDQIFQVLKCCKNIRSLSMQEVLIGEDPGLGKPVMLGALEELIITFAEAPNLIYTLFDNITTPSLKSLNISAGESAFDTEGVPRVWSSASLVTMLQRSGCAVQELVLQVPNNILDSEFREVLESCSTLTYLDVELKRAMQGRETFIYWLFHRLRLPSALNGAFGNHLELLSINEIGAQLDFQDVLDILDTVESRSRISRSRSDTRIAVLQRVLIGFGRLVGNTDLQSTLEERRQELQREGTRVTILPFLSDGRPTVYPRSDDVHISVV